MTNEPVALQEALGHFDREALRENIAIAEKERLEVITRFPLDQWPQMPLERYALGQGSKHDCFCWWMEFGTGHLASMKGGSAAKHMIYRQHDGGWYFNKMYKDEVEAWQAVRAGFVEAFQKAGNGDWAKIDQITALNGGFALRTIALYCYFPDDLLPITSIAHIRHFLRKLGNNEADVGGHDVVRLNRVLLDTLRHTPGCEGWTPKELERFLYKWASPNDQRSIVKIAPGNDAMFWEECLAGGYICVGWGDIGDLRDFDSQETFQAKFAEVFVNLHKSKSKLTEKSKELWTLRELEPGDLIVANKGIGKVLAVGTVVEPGYEYVPDKPDYRHHVHVQWDTSYAQDIPPQKRWGLVTVASIPQTLSTQILSKKGEVLVEVPVDRIYREIDDALDRKRQVILFGPPGTGKTYTARMFAVWWLMKQMGNESPQILTDKAAFMQAEQKLSTGQVVRRVWWVVANPKNWSWDRLFKEGRVSYSYGRLQRNFPLVRKGDLVVGYQSTPDKKLVALAKVSRELFTGADDNPSIELEPVAKIDNGLTYQELQDDAILNESEPMRFRNQGTLFALTEDECDHLAAILTEKNPDLRKHLEGIDSVGPLTRLTFHASYSYEDFIEGYRPVDSKGGHLSLRLEDGIFKRVCREAQANPNKPYLVFIDEFNRANVAKVLGELVTLLEKDKRGQILTLPQSKEPFTIPHNVYVLGTMNTADRSIKLLDAALRRRFAFIEVMPDPCLLQGDTVGGMALDDFLRKLNKRIAAKEGREKQIGHSFLMDGDEGISEPEEFACRFRQEILPLLQEYCYDDYRVLATYIGDGLVDVEGQVLNEERLFDPDRLIEALQKAFADESGAS